MNSDALRFDFDSPAWLALLAVLPLLWWLSRHSLAGLGPVRRWVAIGLRCLVLLALILAAAEMQLVRTSDRLTVIYLLDQSLSIPQERREAMIEWVNAAILQHRREQDRAGVIVFGRDAAIEIPPFDDDVQIGQRIESLYDPQYTNLSAAIRMAQASFPEDAARRIVIVSDGRENLGDALEQAQQAAEGGIGIDVLPVLYAARGDVAVEKVTIPSNVRKGEPFDLRVVLNNSSSPDSPNGGIARGKLIVSQRTGDQPVVLSEQEVELPPGKRVFSLRQEIENPDFYSYEARFVPEAEGVDAMPQNNRATAFTQVRGSGQVLLVEDFENRNEHDRFVELLRADDLEVDVQPSNQLFAGLDELQAYDTVILANVPREHFSDRQVEMLARNTQELGSGLIMLGGPNSFGAGGWSNTAVEEAMPLEFQIKSAKVVPKGALALIMHASELADGNHWQKVIAKEAIRALGTEDYCGLLHWNGRDAWLWGGLVRIGNRREQMFGLIDRMVPGDMPDFNPSLIMARDGFAALQDAAVKHMIIISDGDPVPPRNNVTQGLVALNVTVTTVAVGTHGPADSQVMRDLALATGGKYYQVNNPRALPKIFQREARRVARPLIYEDPNGFSPHELATHDITEALEGELPPITGFVMTTRRSNPLVEVPIISPVPGEEENSSVLATWTYGLGRAVAMTTDLGARWATSWLEWAGFEPLCTTMVRWSMRPKGDVGNFTVATDAEEGRVSVVVTALDENDQFLNLLDIRGTAIGPDMQPVDVELEQVAPGRYVGSFDAAEAGSYFALLSTGPGSAPLRVGINVPYSDEFRQHEANPALLKALAAMKPEGADAGEVIDEAVDADTGAPLVDTFRHNLPPASSRRGVWPELLLLAGLVFLADVFVRRVSVSLGWIPPLAARVRDVVLRRPSSEPAPAYLDRLRSRKEQVGRQLEQQRGATRFEPTAEQEAAGKEPTTDAGPMSKPASAKPPASSGGLAPEKSTEQEGYTERLLKAKKQVWKDREEKKED